MARLSNPTPTVETDPRSESPTDPGDAPTGQERELRAEDLEGLPQSLYTLAIEATSVGICLYDSERVLFVNPAVEEITGFTREELLESRPTDLVEPADRPGLERSLEQRLRGERPAQERFDIKYRGKDGRVRWSELSASRVIWQGQPAVLATLVDVSERRQAEERLRESQERLDLAQRAARYVTWEWDADTYELIVDDQVEAVFGIPLNQVGATSEEFLRLIHPDDREELRGFLRRVRDGEATQLLSTEVRYRLPDGRTGWIGERARLLPNAEKPRRVIGVATDITERKRMELALAAEKERAQVTLQSIGDGVVRTDAGGRVEYLNPVAEVLLGLSVEEAAGRRLGEIYQVVEETTRQELGNPVRDCLKQGRIVEPTERRVLVQERGREFPIQESAAPILNTAGDPTGAVLVIRDVTRMRGMEEEVSFLVTHDPLTGLINRYEFERLVGRFHRRMKAELGQGSLLFFELRGLRVINDTCSYLAGDELLRNMADRLAEALPDFGVLARLGGDEFGILLQDVPPDRGVEAARNLRSVVSDFTFEWHGSTFDLGTSVGLVHLGRGGYEDPLGAAEAACRLAREQGRDRIHVYSGDDERLAQRYGQVTWVHRIPRAMEEDRFVLYRQRIRPLHGGPPLSEILLRLRGTDGEIIGPAEFIPAAERYHLIAGVDRWVARNAFRRIGELRAAGEEGAFAINISGQSLSDEGFLRDVAADLEASGVDPERICFEITETAAVTHLSQANRFMSELRGMGCRFVLDDFGSGLSSFAYLHNLDADFLKVSGEFVRGLAANEVQWALTSSIHELGHLMGMVTIAEGVETLADVAAVEEIGFDYAQGYHFERPSPL